MREQNLRYLISLIGLFSAIESHGGIVAGPG